MVRLLSEYYGDIDQRTSHFHPTIIINGTQCIQKRWHLTAISKILIRKSENKGTNGCLNVRHGSHCGHFLFLSHTFVGAFTSRGLLGSCVCGIKDIWYYSETEGCSRLGGNDEAACCCAFCCWKQIGFESFPICYENWKRWNSYGLKQLTILKN